MYIIMLIEYINSWSVKHLRLKDGYGLSIITVFVPEVKRAMAFYSISMQHTYSPQGGTKV